MDKIRALPGVVNIGFPNGRLTPERVVNALASEGVLRAIDVQRARAALREQRHADLHALVALADLKLPDARVEGAELSLERLTEWLAFRVGLPYLRIDPMKIDVAAVTGMISHAYAARHRILPIEVAGERARIATSEPTDTAWRADLQQLLRCEIELVVVNPLDLHRYTMEFFGVTRSVRGAKDSREEGPGLPSFEQLVELGKSGEVGADDRHVVHIVDWLLQYACEQRASDIHLEPRREVSAARFRIDGVLHKVFEVPTTVITAVVARIKALGRMDLAERRRPQDGRIKTRSPSGREVEMRLSTMPTAFGEKCVLRLFDPDTALKPVEQLGLSIADAERWKELVARPHGIVLVTGPTGSGKTTTLYSTLKRLATPDVNVCTVEDPIELVAAEFNQMQVNPAIDLNFASGVRTLLRQDPDIIMVGEIRDLETAQMAVQAALTGHLVLSTLHTNDAPSAVTRLLDLGIPHYLIATSLNGVLAQRLVRTLCLHCKQHHNLVADVWHRLCDDPTQAPPRAAQGAVGCVECRRTGFLGRCGLYELMSITAGLRALIKSDLDLCAFATAAVNEGMRSLRLAGVEKVAAGVTTVPEVLSVLPPRD